MSEVIHLRNEDITKELFDRAQFVFWAEGGAMGEGGAVIAVADDNRTTATVLTATMRRGMLLMRGLRLRPALCLRLIRSLKAGCTTI